MRNLVVQVALLMVGIVILRQTTETIFPTSMLIVANEYQITCLSALNRIIFVRGRIRIHSITLKPQCEDGYVLIAIRLPIHIKTNT